MYLKLPEIFLCKEFPHARTWLNVFSSFSNSFASLANLFCIICQSTAIGWGCITNHALHLSGFICLKVLIKFFVKSFMVVNPPNAVQAPLTYLLSVDTTGTSLWMYCPTDCKMNKKVTLPYMVIPISGSWPILSAASREFSTSSLTLVYKHLPGCNRQCRISSSLRDSLHQANQTLSPHVVKPGYVLVFCKELGRALLLQNFRFAFCHRAVVQ